MYKCKYFKIQELVSRKVYKKYGDKCWEFFNPILLRTIDDLRKHFDTSITINNWLWGGNFEQRGLRCNLDQIVKDKTNAGTIYISEHILGRAVDFDVKGWSSEQVRQEIIKNKDNFPAIKRMEKDVNWVHIDLKPVNCNGIYLFSV